MLLSRDAMDWLQKHHTIRRIQFTRPSVVASTALGVIAMYVIWASVSLLSLHNAVHENGMRLRSFAADVHTAIALHSDRIRADSASHSKNFTGWEFSLALAEAKLIRMQKVEDVLADAIREVDSVLGSRDSFLGFADEVASNVGQAKHSASKLQDAQQQLQREKRELAALQKEYMQQRARVDELLQALKKLGV